MRHLGDDVAFGFPGRCRTLGSRATDAAGLQSGSFSVKSLTVTLDCRRELCQETCRVVRQGNLNLVEQAR